jgi:hypothetical protein
MPQSQKSITCAAFAWNLNKNHSTIGFATPHYLRKPGGKPQCNRNTKSPSIHQEIIGTTSLKQSEYENSSIDDASYSAR